MFGKKFEINEQTMHIIEEIGMHMPGGFFLYKAEGDEELIYVNSSVIKLFGCDSLDDFKTLTGYTFKGMLYPEDYYPVSASITDQIRKSEEKLDHVEYRIVRKDGTIRWIEDYGHYTETDSYGGIYYVFIQDITEKQEKEERIKAFRNSFDSQSASKLKEMSDSLTKLLANIPAMSFLKDYETGKYITCNRMFAEFAYKSSPDEVIGLTDYDIFDKETADHFAEDDRKALLITVHNLSV